MQRSTGILIGLLVVSNGIWLAVGWVRPPAAVRGDEEVATLQAEIEVLRARAEAAEELAAEPGGALFAAPRGAPPGPGTSPDVGATGQPLPGEPSAGPDRPGSESTAGGKSAAPGVPRVSTPEQIARNAAMASAKASLHKVLQVEDAALRSEGMAEMAAALGGDDADLIEYTLGALWQVRDVELDRGLFRGLVGPLLTSEDAGIRRSALYVTYAMDPEAADVRLALGSATDAEAVVRMHAGRLLCLYTGKRLEGEAAEAVLGLLDDPERTVRRGTLRAMDGATVAPAVEAKLLEVAARPADHREAVQYGLSPLARKSRRVVDALLAVLDEDDVKLRGRAHWGLRRGIRKEDEPYVARRYLAHLPKFVSPKSHREALKLIARYGDASLVPDLERFAENELVDSAVRRMAQQVADHLAGKAPGR